EEAVNSSDLFSKKKYIRQLREAANEARNRGLNSILVVNDNNPGFLAEAYSHETFHAGQKAAVEAAKSKRAGQIFQNATSIEEQRAQMQVLAPHFLETVDLHDPDWAATDPLLQRMANSEWGDYVHESSPVSDNPDKTPTMAVELPAYIFGGRGF